MDKVVKFVLSAQDKTASAFKTATANLGAIKTSALSVNSALSSIGVGISLAGVTALTKSIIDGADNMNDLSQRYGIAVAEMSKYELAANQSGTSMEGLGRGIKALAVNMTEHGAALKAAGVNATNADDAMIELADIFAAMPDGIEKTTLATKLFGKAGTELIPMLNLGSKGLQEAADKSAKYAEQMAIMAPQADAFNDNMAEIGLYAKVAAMSMTNDMLPALVDITKAMAEAAKTGGIMKGIMAGLDEFGNQAFDWAGNAQRKNIQNLTKDLADLQAQSAMGVFGSNSKVESVIAAKIKELDAAQKAYYGITNGNAGRGNVNPASVKTQAADPLAEYRRIMAALKENSGGGSDKKSQQSESDKYAENLQKQIEKTEELTTVQQLGYDINAGRLGKMTTDQQNELVTLAQKLDATKAQTEAEKALSKAMTERTKAEQDSLAQLDSEYTSLIDRLTSNTPTKQFEDQQADLAALQLAYSDGQISEQLYTEAVIERFDLNNEKIKETKSLAEELGLSFTSAFEDAIVGGGNFSDLLDGLEKDIIRIAARKLVTEPLGNYVSSSLSSLGSLAGLSSLFSFDGGGYTGSGSRSGGLDGKGGFLAVMHPQETVTDHTKGQSTGGGTSVVNHYNFTVGDVASVSVVKQAIAASERRVAATYNRSNTYS